MKVHCNGPLTEEELFLLSDHLYNITNGDICLRCLIRELRKEIALKETENKVEVGNIGEE